MGELETIIEKTATILEHLPRVQNEAVVRIHHAQRKQKEKFDEKIRPYADLFIGDKVLLYNAASDSHRSGKLEPKWKGPYYVHDKLPNEVFKLRTLRGEVLVAPINLRLLKKKTTSQNKNKTKKKKKNSKKKKKKKKKQ